MKKFRGILASVFVGFFLFSGMVAAESVSVKDIPVYTAGAGVSASQFNSVTGTIRGIYNYDLGGIHLLGINTSPVAGVHLSIAGGLQLGTHTGDTCNANLAGSLYFNTTNSHFWYCNGTDWRQLDTDDCSICNLGYEYTCTDENGDGTGNGEWIGGTVSCDPVDYDNSGETYYDDDLSDTTKQTLVCASEVPDDAYCHVIGSGECSGSGCECIPVDLAYETRCYDDGGGSDVWQYDDCGNRVGFVPVSSCTTGCTESVAVGSGQCAFKSGGELEAPARGCNSDADCPNPSYSICSFGSFDTTIPLLDDSYPLVHPMHPQYTTGETCGVDEVGCDTGMNWEDPYPGDSYEFGGEGMYNSPRDPNVKFRGLCDETAACGTAEYVATDVAPGSDMGGGGTLCDAGTASSVDDGWDNNPVDTNWLWTCGGVECEAPHYDWLINDWGSCVNGTQTRLIGCTDGGTCIEGTTECVNAGADDGVGYVEGCGGTYYPGTSYLDADADGIPDTSRSCAECVPDTFPKSV